MDMSFSEGALLCLAGAAMGFINNLAGGGGLLGLAALEAFSGLSPIAANAALRPSAVAIGGLGALGFISRGRRIPLRAFGYGLACVPGAVLGSLILVRLPALVYQVTLGLVVLAMIAVQLRGPRKTEARPAGLWLQALLLAAVGLHMGFIQVAVGLLTMLALERLHSRDLVEINLAKAAIVFCTAPASLITLALDKKVAWEPALALALGCGAGSFMASRWSLKIGHRGVRLIVLCVCGAMLLRLVAQLFGAI